MTVVIPTQEEMLAHCLSAPNRIREMAARRVIARRGDLATKKEVDAEITAFNNLDEATKSVWMLLYIQDEIDNTYDRNLNEDPTAENMKLALVGNTVVGWRPDTCECDITIAENAVAVDWVRTHVKCPNHNVNGDELLTTIRGENSRKNTALSIIANVASQEAAVTNQGNWVFEETRIPGTDERVLTMNTVGLTAQQRRQVQSAIDLQVGQGRAVING